METLGHNSVDELRTIARNMMCDPSIDTVAKQEVPTVVV